MIRLIIGLAVPLFTVSAIAQQGQEGNTSSPSSSTQSSAAAQTSTSARATDSVSSTPAFLRIYRHHRYAGSALAPSIYVDDKPVVRIGNGRRATIKLVPGPHIVRSDDKSSAINLDVKAGQNYYIRVDEETGFWKGHGKLTLLLQEQGSAEYKLQKPVEEDRKLAKELIENDSETADAKENTKPQKK